MPEPGTLPRGWIADRFPSTTDECRCCWFEPECRFLETHRTARHAEKRGLSRRSNARASDQAFCARIRLSYRPGLARPRQPEYSRRYEMPRQIEWRPILTGALRRRVRSQVSVRCHMRFQMTELIRDCLD